jgi:hypothetical protein
MITGIIQDKTESTGGEGAKSWRRYAFKIDDKTYSTFSETIGEKFKKGDKVTITGVQEGQYWNMKTMVYAQGEVEVPIVKVGSNNPSTDNKITRMACLKAAVRFFRGAEGIGKENIIELASDFERWVNRDGD